jgi:hypothetical protein
MIIQEYYRSKICSALVERGGKDKHAGGVARRPRKTCRIQPAANRLFAANCRKKLFAEREARNDDAATARFAVSAVACVVRAESPWLPPLPPLA